MTDFDPADTFSGNLPSLPPPPHDDGGDLDVLHPLFPIRLSQPAYIFWQLTSEWEDRETVIDQTVRATQQHDAMGGFSEERFVQPLHHTLPIPAIPAAPPIVYPDLTEPALDDEWDTGPGTAILTTGEPSRHRRRGPGGRFIARDGDAA